MPSISETRQQLAALCAFIRLQASTASAFTADLTRAFADPTNPTDEELHEFSLHLPSGKEFLGEIFLKEIELLDTLGIVTAGTGETEEEAAAQLETKKLLDAVKGPLQ